MMILTTTVDRINQDRCKVSWTTGLKHFGIVEVVNSSKIPIDDFSVIAELLAIKHLLFEVQVFDRFPFTGVGYQLCVKHHVIKDLVEGFSSQVHLKEYIRFFDVLEGITVKIDKLLGIYEDELGCAPKCVIGTSCMGVQFNFISPVLGQTCLTMHAIEQYRERLGSDIPKNIWLSVSRKLNSERLKKLNVPQKVLIHKAMKYGQSNNVEVWGIPQSSMRFLIIKNAEKRTVVTSFCEKRDYQY